MLVMCAGITPTLWIGRCAGSLTVAGQLNATVSYEHLGAEAYAVRHIGAAVAGGVHHRATAKALAKDGVDAAARLRALPVAVRAELPSAATQVPNSKLPLLSCAFYSREVDQGVATDA
jgi:hypothetical protein